ncbi:GntR family transcriptional regulator [Aeromicrobium sp. CF4.19]|uniref:GntR family transcriptional regulator n=1 Tax=Aeromicrobium sp. CF4.19 TaxID=3373082 RepID=UPI003EE47C3D
MSLDQRADRSRARTAHEYVRKELRAAILDGELPGGTRLLQSEIGERLGVSTTPVREALRDLVTEGLVFFDAHRGAVVRALQLDEVREIYELRMTLEPLLVQRVLDRIDDAALDRAHVLWQQMEEETDPAVWVERNHAFHAIFAEPDADSRLSQILAGLRDSATAYVALSLKARPQQMRQANADHGRMLALFRERDAEGLATLTVDHLRSTLAAIESQHPDEE